MYRFAAVCLSMFFSLMLLPPVWADYYQYTDSNGTVVMVDDEGRIPPKYRKKVRNSKSSDSKASKVTPVSVRNNQVRVPVRLSYRNNTVDAQMVLDTGATTTMITTALAERLGINPSSTEMALARVADGSVVQTAWTRLDYIAVGSRQVNNPKVSIMPSRGGMAAFGDGLLGMNFLGEFRYHLDMNSHVIEWQ